MKRMEPHIQDGAFGRSSLSSFFLTLESFGWTRENNLVFFFFLTNTFHEYYAIPIIVKYAPR